jgi:hypothetical protein
VQEANAARRHHGPKQRFTGDGAYDRGDVYGAVAERHPDAARPAPPVHRRARAHGLAEGVYGRRALVEAAISRYKRVIGDALRSRADRR